MDSRCAPSGILCGYAADHGPDLLRTFGPAAAIPTSPPPEGAKSGSMPSDDSCRLRK
jgi:hypothetical protein